MVFRVSGGIRSVAEFNDGEFVCERARRLGRGAIWACDDVELSNASMSILVLIDRDLDASAASMSRSTLVLIELEYNDDDEADVKDDDDRCGNSGMKLPELSSSCSGSVPESSLLIPLGRLTFATSLATADRRPFRTRGFTSTALMEPEVRIFRFMPVTSSFLAARNPAFSSTRSATVFTRSRNWDESPVLKMLRSGACSGLRVSGSE